MIEKKIGNRARTIKMATLSGLCPIQCRKSGTIMLSNGVQAIFIPENREFCKDEEMSTIVSLCNANRIEEGFVTELTTMISEGRRDEAFAKIDESLVKKFAHEEEKKRSMRVSFVESLTSTNGFFNMIENVGLSQDEIEFVETGLKSDLAFVNGKFEEKENERA